MKNRIIEGERRQPTHLRVPYERAQLDSARLVPESAGPPTARSTPPTTGATDRFQ